MSGNMEIKLRRSDTIYVIDVLGEILAGTFGTVPATITPPTTWTADLAPVVYVL